MIGQGASMDIKIGNTIQSKRAAAILRGHFVKDTVKWQ